jgi:hypothetical protein
MNFLSTRTIRGQLCIPNSNPINIPVPWINCDGLLIEGLMTVVGFNGWTPDCSSLLIEILWQSLGFNSWTWVCWFRAYDTLWGSEVELQSVGTPNSSRVYLELLVKGMRWPCHLFIGLSDQFCKTDIFRFFPRSPRQYCGSPNPFQLIPSSPIDTMQSGYWQCPYSNPQKEFCRVYRRCIEWWDHYKHPFTSKPHIYLHYLFAGMLAYTVFFVEGFWRTFGTVSSYQFGEWNRRA